MAKTLINQTDSQGRKQGPWEETDKSGYIEKGHYKDDLRQGLWQKYDPGYYLNDILRRDPTLMSEVPYLNGERHGLWKKYHQNGTLSAEVLYLNDRRHGVWKGYRQDGTIETCHLYNMGKYIIKSPVLILLHWFLLP